MIKRTLIIFASLILFFSCKKDTINEPEVQAQPSLSQSAAPLPLAVGNYWIYQKSVDDSAGTYMLQNVFDSVYVQKDTFMLSEHYFKLVHSNPSFPYYFNFKSGENYTWIKDSLGYLKNYPNELLLDTVHLTDTVAIELYGGGHYASFVPDRFSGTFFYPLGTYSGYWMKKMFIYPPAQHSFNGTYCYQAFVPSIGLARARMLYTSNPYHSMFSHHLIRYHLN